MVVQWDGYHAVKILPREKSVTQEICIKDPAGQSPGGERREFTIWPDPFSLSANHYGPVLFLPDTRLGSENILDQSNVIAICFILGYNVVSSNNCRYGG